MILKLLQDNPEAIQKVKEVCENGCSVKHCSDKDLSVFVSLDLTKTYYKMLRDSFIAEGKEMFPSYYKLQSAKSDCYSTSAKIHISASEASVDLQGILDLTINRILKTWLDKDLENYNALTLISKCLTEPQAVCGSW